MSLLLALVGTALADRPDEGGGLFPFDETDALEHLDGPAGQVRVHYSVSGPNMTLLDDADESGTPDFVEEVALSAENALQVYASLGLRSPLSESALGLDPLGGSDALDIYLVDFGGYADGWFSTDACTGRACAGHMVMENDFAGYGYASTEEAAAILTSHELFHAVQAASNASQPTWMSEGTATWAVWQVLPGTDDFISLSNAYLQDAGRSIDSPPAGAGGAWIYGTALFFQFMTEQAGTDFVLLLQEEMELRDEDEGLDAVLSVFDQLELDLGPHWETFARWNLATGRRAGVAPSYPFAADLRGIPAEAEGVLINDDNRFYPLAATYYRLDHPGGMLRFLAMDDPSGLVFSIHPVADGSEDGPVEDALLRFAPTQTGLVEQLVEVPAGGIWVVGTHPAAADQSVKLHFCLGAEVTSCLVDADTGDMGDTGGPEDTGREATQPMEEGKGCGCASGRPTGLWGLLALIPVLGRLARMRSWPRNRPGPGATPEGESASRDQGAM